MLLVCAQTKIAPSRVLVPLDGSVFAERAVPVAHQFAQRLGVPLELIAVTDTPAGAALARADLAAIAGAEMVDGTHVIIGSDAAAEIAGLNRALRPVVLCLATHGRGRSEAVLGSVADAVIRSTVEPVLAVGTCALASHEVRTGPVVACLDGNDASSAAAAELAGRWAVALDASLVLLTVAEPVPEAERGPVHRHHGPDGSPEEWLAGVAAEVAATWPDLQTTTRVIYDPVDPIDGILTAVQSDQPQLMVVATHARQGLARLVLGSVAAKLIRHSPVPVAVAVSTPAD